MSKKIENTKCIHNNIIKSEEKNISYKYCSNCGIVIIKNKNSDIYLSKPITMEKVLIEDPIKIYKLMRKQDKDFSYISPTIWYANKRKKVLSILKKLNNKLKHSESTLYKALFYLDKTLKNFYEVDITDEQLLYYIVSFFMIAVKFNESGIFNLKIKNIISLNELNNLDEQKMLHYEIQCLKIMNYSLIVYSVYDWLSLFLNNGIILEDEIFGTNKNFINSIYTTSNYILQILINKILFAKYSPFQIAMSIIHIIRDKYIGKYHIENFQYLQKLYHCSFKEYESCYNDIKEILNGNDSEFKIPNQNNINVSNSLNNYRTRFNSDNDKKIKHYSINCKESFNFNKDKIENNRYGKSEEIDNKLIFTKNDKIKFLLDNPKGIEIYNQKSLENRNEILKVKSQREKSNFISLKNCEYDLFNQSKKEKLNNIQKYLSYNDKPNQVNNINYKSNDKLPLINSFLGIRNY